jgi:hypothetical protein
MIRKIGCGGCLVVLGLVAVLLVLFARTEGGQTLLALVMLYGGVIFAGAMAHDTIPGEVIELRRSSQPDAIQAGSIRFAYRDDNGERREEFRRVMLSNPSFDKLKVGDRIEVWVCKNDRSKVKLVGYQTYEPEKCFDQPGDTN